MKLQHVSVCLLFTIYLGFSRTILPAAAPGRNPEPAASAAAAEAQSKHRFAGLPPEIHGCMAQLLLARDAKHLWDTCHNSRRGIADLCAGEFTAQNYVEKVLLKQLLSLDPEHKFWPAKNIPDQYKAEGLIALAVKNNNPQLTQAIVDYIKAHDEICAPLRGKVQLMEAIQLNDLPKTLQLLGLEQEADGTYMNLKGPDGKRVPSVDPNGLKFLSYCLSGDSSLQPEAQKILSFFEPAGYKFVYIGPAVYFSIFTQKVSIVQALLQHRNQQGVLDVDVNAKDHWGHTALISAAQHGTFPIVQALLEHRNQQRVLDVDVNAKDNQGETAFMRAALYGRFPIMRMLLQHRNQQEVLDVDVNAKDDHGFTALMLAAEYGTFPIVQALLLDPRINVNLRNQDGRTAFMIAIEEGRDRHIVRVLISDRRTQVSWADIGSLLSHASKKIGSAVLGSVRQHARTAAFAITAGAFAWYYFAH
jgi:hypothetical protein